MTVKINRRAFTLRATALLAGTAIGGTVQAQSAVKSVTTSLGTYDIPLDPQRVVTIDHRTDLEPALVLGLPVIASGYWADRPWVPVPEGMADLEMPTTAEHVLSLDPDLIICSADEPDDEWWPAKRLSSVAPVLPTSFKTNWRNDLLALGELLDRVDPARAAIDEYDALIADIRARHADTLASKTIVAIQYFPDDKSFRFHLPNQSEYSSPKGDLLRELNVKTVPADRLGEFGLVSYENLATAMEGVNAIYFANSANGELSLLTEDPFWQRLPAVAAGHVYAVNGNTNLGSFYTARHVARTFDELLELLA